MVPYVAFHVGPASHRISSDEIEHLPSILQSHSGEFGIKIYCPIRRHGFRRSTKHARLLFSAAGNLKRKRVDYSSSSHRRSTTDPDCCLHESSSSDPSSPQSAFSSSGTFSSPRSTSSSCRTSPPSSQGSFSELSPILSNYHRNQPRIQVSSLLSDSRAVSYHLEVVQQPQKTAEFRNAPLSRLPVTPPVIVRLVIRDPSGNPVVPESELPFLVAHLSLYSENGMTRLDMGSSVSHSQSAPILYGNLVSSVDQLEDLQGNRGLFFLFPDVSIRWGGRYRLGITLLRLSNPSHQSSATQSAVGLAETRTNTFDVLPPNQYTAVRQTRLTQSFLRQGARMFTFMAPR
ncbi:hypothetical protein K435DRAFT_727147 [Dendrothele bispora CBS 962.96]|uniref:Velvet domain-containing protein n=1 Tax=Dendrothele bispora (strain CBS 962.96) TaxID=1314807 RepID=A0A4S8LQL5_DENBC|nr:hypothetical protein K435DRAFT_727147 [Dendrothele bispora CBS 962.96]